MTGRLSGAQFGGTPAKARTVIIPPEATGVVCSLATGLKPPLTVTRDSGDNTITFAAEGNRITASISSSLSGGASLSAIAKAVSQADGAFVGIPVTLTGAEPANILGYASNPNDLYIASLGLRFPNKNGSIGAGNLFYGQYSNYAGPLWDVPAGSTVEIGYTNAWLVEGNATQNEQQMADDATIREVYLTYSDEAGTKRIIRGVKSNGGILSASQVNGGVIVSFTLPATWPANNSYKLGLSMEVVSGGRMPCGGVLFSGETGRKHISSNFDAVIAAGTALAGVSGSSTGNWSGFYLHPVFLAAKGADGRPVFFLDGDSIAYGKGTPDEIAPNRISGIIQSALARTENGYAIPCIDTSVAGSGFSSTNPDSDDYTPVIRQHMRALIDQLIGKNGGKVPWTHYLCEHGTNSLTDYTTLREHYWYRYNWLKDWHWAPIIQTTLIPKASSADGFRTLGNQNVNSIDAFNDPVNGIGSRWSINEDLSADLMSGQVAAFVNIYEAISYDGGANRDKFKIAPFTATLTRETAASASTIYLNAAPAIGAVLCLDPLSGAGISRVVIGVTEVTAGAEYQVTTAVGSSSGTYPAKPTGTLVGEHYTADGQSSTLGLHVSKVANDMVASWQGPNSFDALKAAIRSAVSGGWS